MKEKHELALKAFNSREFDECEKICILLLNEGDADVIILNLLGIMNYNKNNTSAATAYFEMGIKKDSKNHVSFFNLGKLYFDTGEKDKSLKLFKEILAMKKDFLPAYENILEILLIQNKIDEAQNFIQRIASEDIQIIKDIKYFEGKIFLAKGEINKAYDSFIKTIESDPHHYGALSSLGRLSFIKSNTNDSIAYYKKAIEINKRSVDLINISVSLSVSGELEKAYQYLLEAYKLFPDEILIYRHIAEILVKKSMLLEACEKCHEGLNKYQSLSSGLQKEALDIKQDLEKKLMTIIEKVTLEPNTNYDDNEDLKEKNGVFFLKAMEENNPQNFIPLRITATSTLKNMIERKYQNKELDHELLGEVISIGLLSNFISKLANTNVFLEDFLINVRSFIIQIIADESFNEADSNLDSVNFKNFLGSLALQCHHNEYIWSLSSDDLKNLDKITQSITSTNKNNEIDIETTILALATTKSLKDLKEIIPNFSELKNSKDRNLSKIFNDQISDFTKEKDIKKTIKLLNNIENNVSIKVQKQYEENPYPRWDNMEINKNNYYNYKVQTEISPNTFTYESEDAKILIAGCGTGRHAISTALASQSSMVTAIDLSAHSLAYGIRKAKEMGVSNIEWHQGDILDIKKLDYSFDYIEASGVLHHMKDPAQGFNALKNQLKPNGLMKIGLYSSASKRRLEAIKSYIKDNKIKKTKKDIDKLRDYIKNSEDNDCIYVRTAISDFFKTSEIIDLLIHEQEVFFTIPEIKNLFVSEFNFLGFIFEEKERNYYREQFPDDKKHINLDNWEKLETENPDLFLSMYQFWIQKKQIDSNISIT